MSADAIYLKIDEIQALRNMEADLLTEINEIKMVEEADRPAMRYLRPVDGLFTRWGPVMPVSVVGGNVLLELVRIKRLERSVEG